MTKCRRDRHERATFLSEQITAPDSPSTRQSLGEDVNVNEPNDHRQASLLESGQPAHESHDPLAVRRAAMLTAGIGLVHALLLMAGAFVLKTQTPGVAASDEELVAFYQDPDQRRIAVAAGLYLIPFAGIAFVWFFVALRMWISRAPHERT